MFIFNLNDVFTTNFLKVAQIRVRFSPGFPPGAGEFSAEAALAGLQSGRSAPAYF
jgi:hypothetical protein